MIFRGALRLLAWFAVLLPWPQPAAAEESDGPLQWSFVVGRYHLVGRRPDSPKAYAGTARIERVGARLRLTREIGGKRSRIFGVVRRADPGEAYVLAFQWRESQPMEMVCVIGSDLDNYARLTCHWGAAGNPHRQPGIEAYFAQEPWDPFLP